MFIAESNHLWYVAIPARRHDKGIFGFEVANSLSIEPFGWNLRMCANFDLAVSPVLCRIGTDPIVDCENEGLPEGESAIVSQYGKSTQLVVAGSSDRPNSSHRFERGY